MFLCLPSHRQPPFTQLVSLFQRIVVVGAVTAVVRVKCVQRCADTTSAKDAIAVITIVRKFVCRCIVVSILTILNNFPDFYFFDIINRIWSPIAATGIIREKKKNTSLNFRVEQWLSKCMRT